MNRAIPDDIIEEIRARCDIVDIINVFVPLRKAGSGSWKGLCPFHQERTPSFTVNQSRQHFHCFGCGKGGDVFRFIMEWEKVDFPNAIHLLAARCGVVIPEPQDHGVSAGQAKQRTDQRERLYRINQAFAEFYMRELRQHPESAVARYFVTRAIPPEIADHFQIGAAPDSWDASLRYGQALGFSRDELVEAGIALVNEESGRVYDRFRNRLVFAIWNEQGKVVGFSARTVEADAGGAKYVNSPETPVFKKSQLLYALPLARQAIRDRNFIILCEGQLDVIAVHRAGYSCAVAPQGTAFTEDQARIIKRYTGRVYLAFDMDSAGRKAILRALELLLPLDFEVKMIRWPGGKDPDELYRRNGPEAIAAAVEQPADLLDFLYEYLTGEFDLSTPFGKSRALDRGLEILMKLNNPVAREGYIESLSDRLGLRSDTVFAQLNQLRKRSRSRQPEPELPPEPLQPTEPALPREVRHAEETLLQLALNDAAFARSLAEALPTELLAENLTGQALNEVIALALNDEFDQVLLHLARFADDHPNGELSRILVESCDWEQKLQSKAGADCIATLRRYHRQRQQQTLLARLKAAQTAEEKRELLEAMQKLTAG